MKLLVVAYYFPPFKEVGSVRISKLVKYFRRFGWEIEVVTIKEKYYNQKSIDKSKLNDISSDIRIVKTDRIKKNLKLREEGFYWSINLYKQLNKLLKDNKYDYVFYTAGPFFHLGVAPIISKKYSIPYIVDYRDPWLLSPYNNSKFFKLVAKIIEPTVIKNSKYVINVTEDATNMHIKYYENEPSGKFITIENGYDAEDFLEIDDVNFDNMDGINLVYTGKLGGFRNIRPLFDSIKDYNKINQKKIFFTHIGNEESSIINYLFENPEMKKYIIQKGFLKYKKTLAYIKKSDIAVIISGGHPYEPTTKVYDYIALKKNILCINDINYGYLYDILNDKKNARLCTNDKRSIKKAIMEILGENNKCLDFDLENFNREKIFKKLNDILLK